MKNSTERSHIKWTKQENNALFNAIKRHPENLEKAFKQVSKKTGRSAHACGQHWYYVSKNLDAYTKDKDFLFLCAASKSAIRNRKIIREDSTIKTETPKKGFWKQLINFIFNK